MLNVLSVTEIVSWMFTVSPNCEYDAFLNHIDSQCLDMKSHLYKNNFNKLILALNYMILR